MKEQYTTANPDFAVSPIVASSRVSDSTSSALVRQNLFVSASPHPKWTALYEISKRGFDLTAAIALIILLFPLFIAIALAIRLSTEGPVIFRHSRLGLGGRKFDCIKFRTMVQNAEDLLERNPALRHHFYQKFKMDDDPRVTKLGKFLRSTSLDELPQLFQVVQGKMSLIGPRPIVDREREKYSIYVAKLFSVKPGLSGLWQVSGRSETTYAERVLLDMYYIDHRGPIMDLKIVAKTFVTLLKRTGAR